MQSKKIQHDDFVIEIDPFKDIQPKLEAKTKKKIQKETIVQNKPQKDIQTNLGKKRKPQVDIESELKNTEPQPETVGKKNDKKKATKVTKKKESKRKLKPNKTKSQMDETDSEESKSLGNELCKKLSINPNEVLCSKDKKFNSKLKDKLRKCPELKDIINEENKLKNRHYFECILEAKFDPHIAFLDGENILCNHWVQVFWGMEKKKKVITWEPVFSLDVFMSILHLKSFGLVTRNKAANDGFTELMEYYKKKKPELTEEVKLKLMDTAIMDSDLTEEVEEKINKSKKSKKEKARLKSRLSVSRLREPTNCLRHLIEKHFKISVSTNEEMNRLQFEEQIQKIKEVTNMEMIKLESGNGILKEIVEKIEGNCILIFCTVSNPVIHATYIYQGLKSKMRDGIASSYNDNFVYYSLYLLK